jgi:Cu2+-exporting ATPase
MEHQHTGSQDLHHDHVMNPAMGMAGHDHHKMMIADFKRRFFVVLALTVPIILLSPMLQHLVNVHWQFTGSNYILLALSTIVFAYGGYPFLKGFISEIKAKSPGMMMLIAIAITVAFVYSAATVFGLKGMDFFWELATLILIMLLGHWIEMKSIAGASRELELLIQLMPSVAHLITDETRDVKTDSLKPGDLVPIKPGEKVAADGIIFEGESYLNESMLTGESVPVKKQKGEKVIAGSINGNGSLKVTVSHASKDSFLSKVVKLVNDAQQSKSNTQLLADKAAKWLTVIALVSGAVTFVAWYFIAGKDLAFAIERMVTVIVICCPHALGLAVPLVVAKSTALAAKHGLLIKNRTAFENSRKISTVVFDKTGTLTVGKFQVTRIQSLNNSYPDNTLLLIAAALEQNSEHPIATGIVQKAKDDKVIIPVVADFKAITGKGIEGTVDGMKAMIVSPGYVKEVYPAFGFPKSDEAETVVYVVAGNTVVGFIALADKIRDESLEAIATLKANKIKAILLTGDNEKVAASVSAKLGMDGYFAEVLPPQKLEKIKELQSKGEFVAMTGDGVNDAPALAQADIGIAVGSGSDIAAETAGIVLVNSNPQDIVSLILFGKATYRKMIQNLIWATGYNVIALPLAAGVLYHYGIMLSPAMGAALMSLSTIVVAINANLLRVK